MRKAGAFSYLALAIAIVVSANSAYAEKLGPFVQSAAEGTQAGVQLVVNDFVRLSDPSTASRIRRIKIIVEPRNFDVYGTYGEVSSEGRIIHLPIGFVLALDYVLQMSVFGNAWVPKNFNGPTFDLSDRNNNITYITYLVGQLDTADRNVRAGLPPPVIEAYCEHITRDKAYCDAVKADPRFKSNLINVRLVALSFTLGHELGHFIRNHIEPVTLEDRQKSRPQMELEADAFASELLEKMNVPPASALATLALFGSMERQNFPDQAPALVMPNTECRAIAISKETIRWLETMPVERSLKMVRKDYQDVLRKEVELNKYKCANS
jgi:IrrE N-terminal-like domain